jgi:hypothetical protein
MTIPIFIIEEHHEAFIVWNYAIQQGLLPATGNSLFHVDEHSDMGTPRFNKTIHELNGDINEIRNFTYSELNIAGFIMPAIYIGLFNQIYWIRQKHKKEEGHYEKMYIRSYNQMGEKLISGKFKDLKGIQKDNDLKEFDYFLKTIDQAPSDLNVVLDIDLDYFSCTGNPNENEKILIEITKDEYDNFNKTPYHRLRFTGLSRVETLFENEKFYFKINDFNTIYSSNQLVDLLTIDKRVNHFTKLLEKKQIIPKIINICRSRHSGYTHAEQMQYIENKLIEELAKRYSLQNYQLDILT